MGVIAKESGKWFYTNDAIVADQHSQEDARVIYTCRSCLLKNIGMIRLMRPHTERAENKHQRRCPSWPLSKRKYGSPHDSASNWTLEHDRPLHPRNKSCKLAGGSDPGTPIDITRVACWIGFNKMRAATSVMS